MIRVYLSVQGGGELRVPGQMLSGTKDPTDHLAHILDDLPQTWQVLTRTAMNTWGEFIERVFETEHYGRWASLAQRTVGERAWLRYTPMALVPAFTPVHPILQRAGSLKRSLTDPNFPPQIIVDYHTDGPEEHNTGAQIVSERVGSKNNLTSHWATQDDRFLPLHTGRGLSFMPPRPMVPDTQFAFSPDAKPLFKLLEDVFVRHFEGFLHG